MRVLVAAASKHGSTIEIAEAVATHLTEHGIDTTVTEPERVTTLEGYDAVVLGSGVYAGHWLDSAKKLVHRLGGQLATRPVWLFSSGPVGDPLKPEGDPVELADLLRTTGAGDHRIFGGKIDKQRLGLAERALVRALKVPEGDYRDWGAVSRWSAGIAASLQASTAGRGRLGEAAGSAG